MRTAALALVVLVLGLPSVALARRGGGGHTSSHGGHYSGGHGSSHKGGHYKSVPTHNHYRKHRR